MPNPPFYFVKIIHISKINSIDIKFSNGFKHKKNFAPHVLTMQFRYNAKKCHMLTNVALFVKVYGLYFSNSGLGPPLDIVQRTVNIWSL